MYTSSIILLCENINFRKQFAYISPLFNPLVNIDIFDNLYNTERKFAEWSLRL